MKLQTVAVRQSTRVPVTTAPNVGVEAADHPVRTFRVYCASAIYYAVEPPSNTTALATTNGAPLAAGVTEFIDVPRDMELRLLGTEAANVYVNRVEKLP